MELGITSFAERTPDPRTGRTVSAHQRLRDLLEEIELADQVGLDVFAVGEHHRPDFAVSSPATVLAAASQRTSTIRLGSAVTVLSSDDPVRVFQQFSTVDLLSDGRAEIWAGRGSFTESFPLFGQSLDDYDELYASKLDLLLELRKGNPVTWSGPHRAALDAAGVFPQPLQDPLPVWVAVGGSPQSVVRAGTLGLPLVLAIIGGMPERFKPLVDLYRQAAEAAGHDPKALKVAVNTHGYVGEDARSAARDFHGPYTTLMDAIGRERGWPPMSMPQYEASLSLRGALATGGSEQVVEKVLHQHELFGHDRFLIQPSVGTMPHDQVMRSIERFGTEVAPAVRDEVARRGAVPA